MIIYIKHGDNDQFLVNSNCPVVVLTQYIKIRLRLAESELIDLCDEQGVLKFLFLPQNSQESACGLLKARESFIICVIKQTLQNQIDNLEKTRLQQLRTVEALMVRSEKINAQAPLKITKKRKKVTHVNAPGEGQSDTGNRKSRN